jgi:hypothetical protein
MGRRPHRPSRRAYGPRRGLAASDLPGVRPQPRKTPSEDGKEPHLPAATADGRSNGRRWNPPPEHTGAHKHPIAYAHASGVVDGYAVVAKLYDHDTSSKEAHTAALIAIEGRLNLIAHCLRAIADNSGADVSTVSMLGTEKNNQEVHQEAGLRRH